MLKKTPLHAVYQEYDGVKLIDFGGWELPVSFKAGIIAEHMAVRGNAGLFDVSHMGEIYVEGAGSEDYLDWLMTNDVKAMAPGQVIYTLMCYPHGGVVDDLLVYKHSTEKYLLVVNASNSDKDFNWIKEENPQARELGSRLSIRNRSADMAQLAFQGPKAEEYLQKLVNVDLARIPFFHFKEGVIIAGQKTLVSRTGYTGEDGFEIYLAGENAPLVWNAILADTRAQGVMPCGLGARDTLRFEAKLPLYGNEISESINPLEAGLKYFVKLGKNDFCGKAALSAAADAGVARVTKGCEMLEKGVPRHGCKVYRNGAQLGFVTSGTKSPMLDKFVGLILVKARSVGLDDVVEIEINNKLKKAKIVKTPFYKMTSKSKRKE